MVYAIKRLTLISLTVLWTAGFTASFAYSQPAPQTIATHIQAGSHYVKTHNLDDNDLRAIYKTRNYKPIWNTESKIGRDGIAVFLKSLKDYADYHGINQESLPFAKVDDSISNQETESNNLDLEILVTDLLIKVTRRMRGDDLNLKRVYSSWPFQSEREPYLPELIYAIQNGGVKEHFRSLPPSDTKYKRLALVLKTYRRIHENGGWPEIPYGATIKENRFDERIPLVYARLKAEGYDVPEEIEQTYSQDLQEAVTIYQVRNGLEADGEVGTTTVKAMNVSVERRIKQIIANMERMRHMPQYYEGKRVEVNMANSTIKVWDDKDIIYEDAVIVGSKWRKTPFIKSEIKTLIFNPSWYVPNSIASNDILKKLKKNPLYLKEMGYSIQGNEEDPQGLNIDWANMTPRKFKYFLRQSPSKINALGKVKFNFENPYAVYLHGTPKMKLFNKADRHLSSGCIRLKDPIKFAEIMLEENVTEWSRPAIEHEINKKKTKWVTVVGSVPVSIVYESVYFPTADSPVHFNHDIYKYDKRLAKRLFANKNATNPNKVAEK